MSMKPQFDTYRYVGEVCRLHGQSIVECRLPGSEISSILAVQAKAVPAECACADGEVQYGGRVLLSVVYAGFRRGVSGYPARLGRITKNVIKQTASSLNGEAVLI